MEKIKCEYCGQFLSESDLDKLYKNEECSIDGKMLWTNYPVPEPWGEIFWHKKCEE